MKPFLKYALVAAVAFGVSSVADSAANALSKRDANILRKDIRAAIKDQIVATELMLDAIDERLENEDLSRDEERALIKERRMLNAMILQLKQRRQRAQKWNDNQLIFWSKVFLPDEVSPA